MPTTVGNQKPSKTVCLDLGLMRNCQAKGGFDPFGGADENLDHQEVVHVFLRRQNPSGIVAAMPSAPGPVLEADLARGSRHLKVGSPIMRNGVSPLIGMRAYAKASELPQRNRPK